MSLAIVIMAAGKGTRLKSRRPKVLHAIGGKPLLRHVLDAATQVVPAAQIFVVVGHEAERVQAAVADTGVYFVQQPEQLGTGHAIQCARQAIAGYESILVLSGDVPLIRPETLETLLKTHALGSAMTILTAVPGNPYGYGRILRRERGKPEVAAIIEQKSLNPDQLAIPEINSGIYAFQTQPLLAHLQEIPRNQDNGEYYLTDLAQIFVNAGERVTAVEAPLAAEVLGVNIIAELVALDATLRAQKTSALMGQGVTIFRPETCIIDADVQIGPDTIVEPFVQILGKCRIGSDCLIRSSSILDNATIGDNVVVLQSSAIFSSSIGSGARIGPFANIRPGCEIGDNAHIGNFVEAKNVRFGNGSKANHLTYLGDASVGSGSNIGAGVITCNYDGAQKHRTTIGDGVFIGSDSQLVAPITVGDNAYIGAGSCITREVPAGALAVGRARQMTKEGWAASKLARKQSSS
jgi:bifunctional UDP-N-acetylglucosamine pyrophosphorylase/glucosamine-1-phosphate N-acetyltransferase